MIEGERTCPEKGMLGGVAVDSCAPEPREIAR